MKSSIGFRSNILSDRTHRVPTRLIRRAQYQVFGSQTRLRYKQLAPNYDTYWQPDSDAAISLDSYESMLWFQSRGDACLNCGSPDDELLLYKNPLIIKIQKPEQARSITIAPKLDPSIAPSFTSKQGQYLAFIYNYTRIHGRAPAESDLERYFQVSPPSVHDMIKTPERHGLIERSPGRPDPFVSMYTRRTCRDWNRVLPIPLPSTLFNSEGVGAARRYVAAGGLM